MIDAHLRTRLLSEAHAVQETVLPSYREIALPILQGFGVSCELAETYSAEKRTEIVTIEGRTYLVFDHALAETFNLLNRLTHLKMEGAGSFIAAALYRPLAEALRDAQQPSLYAYFVRRALEAKPFTRAAVEANPNAAGMFWQNLVILFHEAAHALPADGALRVELTQAAMILASGLANDLILGMTGQLSGLLEPDGFGQRAEQDMEVWRTTKDDLGIGDDAIYETYAEVGSDPRFLDELMCDFFAIACVTDYLRDSRVRTPQEAFPDIVIDAFQACHSAFLHMRLLKYFADVTRDLPRYNELAKINPLQLRQMVELSFRSNIVVQRLIDAAGAVELPELSQKLAQSLAAVQDAHTANLFNVGNELLELTLFNADFHASVPDVLEQDGFDLSLLDEAPLDFFEAADGFWQVLVA
jgi:hypothetical protein